MQHFSFPSIELFYKVIKAVNERARYDNVPVPTLRFHGAVKMHGTNASIVLTHDGEFYAQSRNGVITPEADNAGFARFAHEDVNRSVLTSIANYARQHYFDSRDYVEPFDCHVAVYGEWVGKGVQSGVALSSLPKMFVIFGARLISKHDPEISIWLMPWEVQAAVEALSPDNDFIHSIESFPTWNIDIDFSRPEIAQNELVALTAAVEAECPVGARFGVKGVGEGIVWTCVGMPAEHAAFNTEGLTFKVKGEKHSDTKVSTTAPVDIERLNSIRELAESLVTDHRLEKGVAFLRETLHKDDVLDVRNMGAFLKWIGQDIAKEDLDTIEGNGFGLRDVTKEVNNVAKAWFTQKVTEAVGL